MNIFGYPGNLGGVRGSIFTVHHADWPSYPQGEDFQETLFQLAAFPKSTSFLVIDDIDRSLLMVADVQGSPLQDPFNSRNFHVAAWHEDLAAMQEQGFIDGITSESESEWKKAKWMELVSSIPEGAKIGIKNANGDFVELQPPEEIDGDDYEPCVVVENKTVRITDNGRKYVFESLLREKLDLAKMISSRVEKLFELQYFDTCIREACVQLEHEIKTKLSSTLYGDRLSEAFVEKLRSDGVELESTIRAYRQELRSVFKLIRNNYMHNLAESDEVNTYIILFRIARVRSMLNQPERRDSTNQA